MIIENIRFKIVSQGLEKSEIPAVPGDTINLKVRELFNASKLSKKKNATITAKAVENMGFYSNVIGEASINGGKEIPCRATYEIGVNYLSETQIGELVLKKII